ncbi:MAG TPA: hypothetical protein VK141_05225 [Nitrosomonas sp.]|nr:hypothetical protein [Nitrosomonas sp.]
MKNFLNKMFRTGEDIWQRPIPSDMVEAQEDDIPRAVKFGFKVGVVTTVLGILIIKAFSK